MKKTILITGSTDGIGLATAKTLAALGHNVLLHGRSSAKLASTKDILLSVSGHGNVETYQADLSVLSDVKALADEIKSNHSSIDVLINNAGVYVVPKKVSFDNLDVRYAVNTIAPYLLTRLLLPLLKNKARVVNLSSAAQASVKPSELSQPSVLSDSAVYARSKLAITMWTTQLAKTFVRDGLVLVSVNPASMLGSKMVKSAYGVVGGDIQTGADVLVKASTSDEFENASGLYFDNDIGRFANPHPDALVESKRVAVVNELDKILSQHIEEVSA
ncbi:SDR family NAD(P)-dependent oxidoreductase [Glaciecola sp. 2405UD65-10]|uniref:SDR family NAD(P)-dependent oxidoreductase n=1 Tax=Glaciecola sp. 2405UD65-10 TaxID=3397244 RepID=UPI003B5A3914